MTTTPNTHFNFEGLVPADQAINQLGDYNGLHFDNIGAIGRLWPRANGYGDKNGIYIAANGHVEGITEETVPGSTLGTISNPAGLLTINSGVFAAAWLDTGEDVTFTGIRNGHVVGTMTVNLTTTPEVLHFDKDFKHLDSFEISATSPLGFNSNVVMDSLKIELEPASHALPPQEDAFIPHHHDWVS